MVSGYRVDAVAEETIIREFRSDDLGAIVEFSPRMGTRLPARYGMSSATASSSAHPRLEGGPGRRGAIRVHERGTGCVRRGDGRTAGRFRRGRPERFLHEGMGVIDIIGVDPDFQRRGISFG